jgi:hypothetical protein
MRRLCWLFLILVLAVRLGAQDARLPTPIQAEEWIAEAEALLQSIRSTSGAPAPSVRQHLVDILERGNRIMQSTLRESAGEKGVGEAFGEPYSALLGILQQFGNMQDQRTLEVLVRGSYNEDSPFGVQLAKQYGERIAPIVLEMSRSDFFAARVKGTQMLGTILRENRDLKPETISAIRTAILRTAFDEQVMVRLAAVGALEKAGTSDDISVLQQLAVTDPASIRINNGQAVQYPVRQAAQKALAAIRQRNPR